MPTDSDLATALRRKWAEQLTDHMKVRDEMSRKELRRALADFEIEVSEQAIGCWLRGETAPRPEHQAALAAIFQVPVRSLFPIEPASRKATA